MSVYQLLIVFDTYQLARVLPAGIARPWKRSTFDFTCTYPLTSTRGQGGPMLNMTSMKFDSSEVQSSLCCPGVSSFQVTILC